MAWQTVKSWTYNGENSVAKGELNVNLQYNDTTETPTSVSVRFTLAQNPNVETVADYFDTFFLLMRPTTSSRYVYSLKPNVTSAKAEHKAAWPYIGSTFTLTKSYNATTFALPAFWICSYGSSSYVGVGVTDIYNNVNPNGSEWLRKYTTTVAASAHEISTATTVATDIGTGTTTIKDNLNNSFTITATKGANGVNNTAYGPVNLKWGYDNSNNESNTYTNNQTIVLARNNPASSYRYVHATSTTTCGYGNYKVATAYQTIRQYYSPGNPGVPTLKGDSFKNGRLTVKQPWTYSWSSATKRGYGSGKGYRIRVKKNGSFIKGLVYTNGSLTLGTGTKDYVDSESTSNSVTFNPENLGFKAGDTVQLRIHAYTKNGLGQTEWSVGNTSFNLFSAAVDSPETTVQNAGVVHVKTDKTDAGWKEGQVYVKIDSSTWVEAETVFVKTSSTVWVESE